MAKTRVGYTIDTQGGTQSLFSVHELEKSDDLLIRVKAGPRFGIFGNKGPSLKSISFSVHASPKSRIGNTITCKTIIEGQRPLRVQHFTKAIKSNESYSFLLTKRCYNLSLASILNKSTRVKDDVSLGYIDSTRFTLFFSVLIGPPEKCFDVEGADFFSFQQSRCFSKFSIVVLWTFVSCPADHSSESAYLITEKPELVDDEEIRRRYAETTEGFDQDESVGTFIQQCDRLFKMYFARKSVNMNDVEARLLRESRMFKEGVVSPEYIEHYANVINEI